jgi:hypothetical protein
LVKHTRECTKVGGDEPVALIEATQIRRDGDQGGADNGDFGRGHENAEAKACTNYHQPNPGEISSSSDGFFRIVSFSFAIEPRAVIIGLVMVSHFIVVLFAIIAHVDG